MESGSSAIDEASAPAGVYIHVPFCRSRCSFCDFATTTEVGRAGEWTAALERELDLRAPDWPIRFDSVYFGGGTPSLLGPETAARLLAAVRRRLDVAPDAEVTLEANPGDLDGDDLAALLAAGVNRLSLGVQSFDDRDLAFLGRSHSVRDSLESFHAARAAGFRNITMDLLYGIPGCPRSRWEATIERAAALGPEHLSAYGLIHEPGAALTRRIQELAIEDLTDEAALDLFLFTREQLEDAGYIHFEVSSFPRTADLESRHNRKYWEGAPYLGLGPAAHSFRGNERCWNPPRIDAWASALAAGRDPAEGRETLGPSERMMERIFLGLRLSRGLDVAGFEREFGVDLRSVSARAIALLEEKGLAFLDGSFLRLTALGLAIADEAALLLVGPLDAPAPAPAGAGAPSRRGGAGPR